MDYKFKSVTKRYKDTPENRKLGRVGKSYTVKLFTSTNKTKKKTSGSLSKTVKDKFFHNCSKILKRRIKSVSDLYLKERLYILNQLEKYKKGRQIGGFLGSLLTGIAGGMAVEGIKSLVGRGLSVFKRR